MSNPPNKQQEAVMSEVAGLLVPSKGRHAVQQFTLAAEFLAPISPEDLAYVSKLYETSESLKKWFTRKTEERRIEFNFTITGSASDSAVEKKESGNLSGVNFERVVGETPEWVLSLKLDSIVIMCSSYTRWKEISTQALALLAEIFSALPAAMIKVSGLQYVDEFYWNGEKDKFHADIIFDRNSTLLPSSVFSKNNLWHNHSGWFDEITEPQPCKTLTNINVNVLEQPNRVVAQILTVHKATLHTHAPASQFANLAPVYEKLHEENKTQLRLLLNESTRELISLGVRHAAS